MQLVAGLPCGFSVIVNGGDAIGKGAEFELVAEPTDAWRMNLSVAYNRSEFDKVVGEQRLHGRPALAGRAASEWERGPATRLPPRRPMERLHARDYTYVGNVMSQYGPIGDAFDTTNLRLRLPARRSRTRALRP